MMARERRIDNKDVDSKTVSDDVEISTDTEMDLGYAIDASKLLTEVETYLKSGVHIGTKFKSGEMREYIFKKRKDGLMVFNIQTIDDRIRMVAKILSKYTGDEVLVVSRRLYGHKPIKKFAELTGAKAITGRFVPGTLTNPTARLFLEPKLVVVCDPLTDFQAIKEATAMRIPVISLAGSDSPLKDIDMIIPANNRGRKAIALIFFLLARETLIERKEISKEAFKTTVSEFEQEIEEKKQEKPRRRFSSNRNFRKRSY
jgi:small subunit ribosomal protein S2